MLHAACTMSSSGRLLAGRSPSRAPIPTIPRGLSLDAQMDQRINRLHLQLFTELKSRCNGMSTKQPLVISTRNILRKLLTPEFMQASEIHMNKSSPNAPGARVSEQRSYFMRFITAV